MPGGRPTKLTPQLISQIAELFFLAFTDQQVAFIVGVNERTIRRYRAGEFCPEIKIAELKREAIYRKKIWAAKGFWQGAAWFLERKYPTQFAKPEVQMNLNMQHNETHQTLIIVAEQAKEIAGRVHEADTKWNQLLKAKNVTPNGNGNGHSHPEAKS